MLLLAVSITLGALSTLFAAAALQEEESRGQLLGHSLRRIQRAIADLSVYQTARDRAKKKSKRIHPMQKKAKRK